jgi:flavin-dependent dehydrogenase
MSWWVGAGRGGLTLAMNLAWRGADVVVLEFYAQGETKTTEEFQLPSN